MELKRRFIVAGVSLIAASLVAGLEPPDAETLKTLAAADADLTGNSAITGANVEAWVAGEKPDQIIAALAVVYEYSTETYAVLLTRTDKGWALAAPKNAIVGYNYGYGDDNIPAAPATMTRTAAGDETYYAVTADQYSAGSGMASHYVAYDVFTLNATGPRLVFEGTVRASEDYYARWYGGDDSSAWAEGGHYASASTFGFEDVDGDGVYELWEDKVDGEQTPSNYSAILYAAGEDGSFTEAPFESYRAALEKAGGFRADYVLAEGTLAADGDVATARAYYEKAATAKPEAAAGIREKVALLKRLGPDSREAVRLFFSGEYEGLVKGFPKSAAAAEAAVTNGDIGQLVVFLGRNPHHPRWLEAFRFAAAEATGTGQEDGEGVATAEFKILNKYLRRYEKEETDLEEEAKTLTRLGDGYYHLNDVKHARTLYERSLAVKEDSTFADYNMYRLGDCAAAAGKDGQALDAYLACISADGWWAWQAEEALKPYLTLETADGTRNFGEFVDTTAGMNDVYLAVGDLDKEPGVDIAAIVTTQDRRDGLYCFFRRGGEFRGYELIPLDGGKDQAPGGNPLFDINVAPVFPAPPPVPHGRNDGRKRQRSGRI